MATRRAIVTGGSGLIGGVLCARLSAAGWEVASFDQRPGEGPARHIPCDLADEASVAAGFAALCGVDRRRSRFIRGLKEQG